MIPGHPLLAVLAIVLLLILSDAACKTERGGAAAADTAEVQDPDALRLPDTDDEMRALWDFSQPMEETDGFDLELEVEAHDPTGGDAGLGAG